MSPSIQPLISVVIPTHNRAQLITQTIASVRAQSYQHWEILVVDDCSNDNTTEVVEAIAAVEHRLKYYRHQTNQGGSTARNTGIAHANGDYIAFLDSDDEWLPHKLELQLQTIQQNAQNRDRVVSYTQFQKSESVFYQPAILPRRGKYNQESLADYLWLKGGETLTSTLLVSRSLAVARPWQSTWCKHEDWDFILGLESQAAEFIFIPQVLTIWHNEPRSDRVSRRSNYQISLDWIEAHREQISESAYQGFLLKEVAPKLLLFKDTKTAGIKLLFKGLKAGIIPWYYFLFLVAKQAISPELQQNLKNYLYKLKLLKMPN